MNAYIAKMGKPRPLSAKQLRAIIAKLEAEHLEDDKPGTACREKCGTRSGLLVGLRCR